MIRKIDIHSDYYINTMAGSFKSLILFGFRYELSLYQYMSKGYKDYLLNDTEINYRFLIFIFIFSRHSRAPRSIYSYRSGVAPSVASTARTKNSRKVNKHSNQLNTICKCNEIYL